MIDLHCHILPAVDDGAQNIEDSLAMGRKAVEQGITHILCTPHHHNGRYDNPANKVIHEVDKLQQVFDAQRIPVTLLEGQEVRIFGEIIDEMDRGQLLFTDVTDTYLLIEFPSIEVPRYAEKIFFELLSRQKVPVIVHPERNAAFQKDFELLKNFIEMGALTQLTAPSIIGKFGKKIQKTSIKMMEQNLLHTVASDAHGISRRNFYLKEAYEAIELRFGKRKVSEMMQFARMMVNGDPIQAPLIKKTKKRFFGF